MVNETHRRVFQFLFFIFVNFVPVVVRRHWVQELAKSRGSRLDFLVTLQPMTLLPLRQITLSEVGRLEGLPLPRIRDDRDVEKWKTTVGYRDYGLFLRRLNESVVGFDLTTTTTSSSQMSVTNAITLLDTLDQWIDEIPPLPTPQRFGNLAFRTWGQRLEEVRVTN
jgi:hypothetical protein